MNCKPGDLAVVRGPTTTPNLAGRVVTVIRRAVPGETFQGDVGRVRWNPSSPIASWVVESANPLPWLVPESGAVRYCAARVIADAHLRPIRDNDGPDETLAWAGKPNEVTA